MPRGKQKFKILESTDIYETTAGEALYGKDHKVTDDIQRILKKQIGGKK